ncbi:MAG: XrtA/PEP-CTERM system histidine kinase PrsK [Rhodospirillaceae bacterium]
MDAMRSLTLTIGAASYGAAAAAFLVLSMLLASSWRGRLPGMLLTGYVVLTGVWALALAYESAGARGLGATGDVLEVLRSGAWFLFLLVLLGYSRTAMRPLRVAAVGIVVYCAASLAVVSVFGGAGTGSPPRVSILSALILAVIGMVLVEQLFRNAEPQQRWGIKFLCLGLCGMFAYDLYLYSHTLLFRGVDPEVWAARGAVNALVVPLLAVATARNPKWSVDLAVSRRIVFHSTIMLGASGYLVAMAGIGYYIRYVGGTWGGVLQATLLFAAVLMLFVLFFSGTVRTQIKLFLSKNFFSYRYDYREEWLRFTRTLSEGQPGIRLRERSIQAIAELVDSPGGALWLARDTGGYAWVADWNMPAARSVTCPPNALPASLEQDGPVIDLTGAGRDSGAPHGDIPQAIRAIPQAWLLVPLILHEKLLGFVVLARSRGKITLNWEVSDILSTAGRQAASYLAQLEAAKALLIARQFESFNRMSAFVVHDLKNVVAQLSLLLTNAERHKHNPEFQKDMVETVAHSVDKMKRLLLQLRGGYTLGPAAPVLLQDVLARAVAARAGAKPIPTLELPQRPMTVTAHALRLERVIGHLIQNAIEATPADGEVRVRLVDDGEQAIVEIADTGCGMSEAFVRDRLFSPFDSTKATGMGIGTYEAQQYVHELGGRIDVRSSEGDGSVFRIALPVRAAAEVSASAALLEVQT